MVLPLADSWRTLRESAAARLILIRFVDARALAELTQWSWTQRTVGVEPYWRAGHGSRCNAMPALACAVLLRVTESL